MTFLSLFGTAGFFSWKIADRFGVERENNRLDFFHFHHEIIIFKFTQEEEDIEAIELGNKMVLLMDILRECELIGDKVPTCYTVPFYLYIPDRYLH